MPRSNDIRFFGTALKRAVLIRVLPRLGEFPQGERDELLARAQETPFDLIEWIGVLAGVAFVTWLLRVEAAQAAASSLPVLYFVQYVTAAALLALLVGPFYLRRTLRGIDQEIERRRREQASGIRR